MLGLLLDRPMNGYMIKQTMEISTANFIRPSYGNIYPTLKTLEKKGFIRSTIHGSSNKKTTFYQVTEEGHKLFKTWLLSPVEDPQFGHNHLLHLFFYRHLTKGERTNKTNALITFYQNEINKLITLKKSLKDLADPFQMTTIDYGIMCYQSTIAFYQERVMNKEQRINDQSL
jgi:DNA-binding PadR family transcriptional regulator